VDTGARRRIKSLEKAIGQLKARQDRLVRNLELDDDTDGVTFRRIRERMDELENERLRKLKDLHALRGEEPDADPASPDLLDQLPAGDVSLSSAPEHVLRRMFESFRLQVRYDKVASWATCRVAIREEVLDQLLTDSSALSHRKRTIQKGTGATRSFARGTRCCGQFRGCSFSLVALSASSNASADLASPLGPAILSTGSPEALMAGMAHLSEIFSFSPISPRARCRDGRRLVGLQQSVVGRIELDVGTEGRVRWHHLGPTAE
jgi:hypothetical protein